MALLLGRCWHISKYTLLMKLYKHTNCSHSISRRDFLRFSSIGVAASLSFFLPSSGNTTRLQRLFEGSLTPLHHKFYDFDNPEVLAPNQQGRVVDAFVDVYDIPSFDGTRVNRYWRDWVLPITDITVGKSEDSFNMVWYKIGNEGFVHSGLLQPVFTVVNDIHNNIPPGGTLGEVTVPFTDSRWKPGENETVAYRFYYATTYWVMELVQDESGNPWYGVRDDKWEYMFYIPAIHLRIIPADELAPLSANVPSSEKRIEVHIPEQVMIAYEYDQPVFMARIASGAVFSNGDYSTPIGRHEIFHKRASRHMARGNLAANGYDLPGVPWNSYITEDGIAFHGTYWHNNFGRPRSHGCINLTPQAAKWVYLWSKPEAPPEEEDTYKTTGTAVDIVG
jgi:lipoprotein-anchoring transpeptidase ErfK/SrfK